MASSELFAKLNKWKDKADLTAIEAQGQSTEDRAKYCRASDSTASTSSSLSNRGTTASNGKNCTTASTSHQGGSSSSTRPPAAGQVALQQLPTVAKGGAQELAAKLGKWKTAAEETALESTIGETTADAKSTDHIDDSSKTISTRGSPTSCCESDSKASTPAETDGQGQDQPQDLLQKLSKWRDKAENQGEKFESVPTQSCVDRRAGDTKLKVGAAEFVPGGLSEMLGRKVAVSVESMAKSGVVGSATWSLSNVPEAADMQSDQFSIPNLAGDWQLELCNSVEDQSVLKLTGPTHVVGVRVSFFAGKQLQIAQPWGTEGVMTKVFKKLTSDDAVEVGIRWKTPPGLVPPPAAKNIAAAAAPQDHAPAGAAAPSLQSSSTVSQQATTDHLSRGADDADAAEKKPAQEQQTAEEAEPDSTRPGGTE
ncbi:unnamed protein product [Amoebophrya sp. A120]|nr:unnamed protein product [Amoebophrya sp. A120]|eukprot:GSA120T00001579001.1